MAWCACTPLNWTPFSCTHKHTDTHTQTRHGYGFVLREIDVTKYFSVNQSFWIICKSTGRFGHTKTYYQEYCFMYYILLYIYGVRRAGADTQVAGIIIMSISVSTECVFHSNTETERTHTRANGERFNGIACGYTMAMWQSRCLSPKLCHMRTTLCAHTHCTVHTIKYVMKAYTHTHMRYSLSSAGGFHWA